MKYLKIKLEQVVMLPAFNLLVSPGNIKVVCRIYVYTRNFQQQALPSQDQSSVKCYTYHADRGAFINNLQNQHLIKHGSGSSSLQQPFLHALQWLVSTVGQLHNLQRQAVPKLIGYLRCYKELDPKKKNNHGATRTLHPWQSPFSVLNYPGAAER